MEKMKIVKILPFIAHCYSPVKTVTVKTRVCCWTAVCLVFTIEPVDSFLSQGFVMFSNCVFNEGLKPSGAVNVFLFSSHSR